MKIRSLRRMIAVLLALVVFGCVSEKKEAEKPVPAPTIVRNDWNLIVISIDTLRADRLGAYGYGRPTSPAFDALAERGALFLDASANSSWTLPSHMTLFTGLHPSAHDVILEEKRLPASVPTLSEVLRDRGYRNFAYTGGRLVSGLFGFDRGFESYLDVVQRFSTSLTLGQRAIEAMARGDRYFLFLHTYDVHCPYDPADEYVKMFQTRLAEDRLEVAGRCGNPDFNERDLTPGQTLFLSDQYDAGVREADDDLAEFVAFLDASGTLEDTVLVVLSDHGEELHEHGRIGHERTLHRESLQVPLLMLIPGLDGRVVRDPVSLVDVMPTLLDLFGIDGPSMQGRSLLPMLEAAAPIRPMPQFAELDLHLELRSIALGSHHLIRESNGETLLYDIEVDPEEQRDLSGTLPSVEARLQSLLDRHLERLTPEQPASVEEVPPELKEQLEALGYLD